MSEYTVVTPNKKFPILSSVDSGDVMAAFKQYGAILFRGFNVTLTEFVGFTDKFCYKYMLNPSSSRKIVSSGSQIQTVDRGTNYFPLHAERSQTPFQPDIAFFHCIKAPQGSGQTFFCDGTRIIGGLPAEIRRQLAGRSLLHRNIQTVEQLLAFLGIEDPRDIQKSLLDIGFDKYYRQFEDKYYMHFMRPFFSRSKFSGEMAFANFLLFSRFKLNNLQSPCFENGDEIPTALCQLILDVAENITTKIEWEALDILMIDNTRLMHGRMPFDNVEDREIFTRFGYSRI